MLLYHLLLADRESFSINHNIVIFDFHIGNIFFYLFFAHHFQMLKQNVYLHLENLAQLNVLSLHFCANNSGFGRYLFQLIVFLKPDFNCGNNFELS